MAAILKIKDPITNEWAEIQVIAGKSAYKSAQSAGYTGTEEEFNNALMHVDTKIDKTVPSSVGNIATLTETGSLADSEKKLSDLQPKLTFDNVPTNESLNPITSAAVYNAMLTVSKLSTRLNITLLATSWNNGQYIIMDGGVLNNNTIDLTPDTAITSTQLEALQNANIIESSQSTGALIIKCFGDIPTIDIPVVFTFHKDSN